MEEMNTKDTSLDQLLNKLGGAIEGRDLSPDAPAEVKSVAANWLSCDMETGFSAWPWGEALGPGRTCGRTVGARA